MADFAVNKDIRDELVTALTDTAALIETLTGEIYTGIDGMGGEDSWSGKSYDSFKTMCHGYEGSLTGLHDVLLAFSKVIGEQIDGPQETLESELHSALD